MSTTDIARSGDYALIADCHTAALVSREGSVDWCCVPRFDSGNAFARVLDYAGGGYCGLTPADGGSWESKRSYIEDSFVLETTLTCGAGEVRLVDCFVLHEGEQARHERRIVRVIEGVKGSVGIVARRSSSASTLPSRIPHRLIARSSRRSTGGGNGRRH